jgi:hypothetical protein
MQAPAAFESSTALEINAKPKQNTMLTVKACRMIALLLDSDRRILRLIPFKRHDLRTQQRVH